MTNEQAAKSLIDWHYNGGMMDGEAFNLAIAALRTTPADVALMHECVVCHASLWPKDETAPHCEDCSPDDEQQIEWEEKMAALPAPEVPEPGDSHPLNVIANPIARQWLETPATPVVGEDEERFAAWEVARKSLFYSYGDSLVRAAERAATVGDCLAIRLRTVLNHLAEARSANPSNSSNSSHEPAPDAAAMREAARLQGLIDCACNALTDSICASGNDAATNLHFVGKLRRDAIPPTPLPAPDVPDVPEAVRAWAHEYDEQHVGEDEDDHLTGTIAELEWNLREWIRKEYGL